MKVRVVSEGNRQYRVEISQGYQYFTLAIGMDRSGSKRECDWFAKMFNKAISQNNREIKKQLKKTTHAKR